jgi:threonylcarbamoyladenosine tRNA methylthiotransferase MtaB
MAFGADLIAGFPTEDEAMFGSSLSLIEECGLDFLHVFAYSPRPGTPAARMPQVPGSLRKDRAARLRAGGEKALARLLSAMVGTTQRVLVEAGGRGHAENFALVETSTGETGAARRGDIAAFHITAQRDGRLIGRACRQ